MEQNENWEPACDAADFDGEEMMECHVGEHNVLLVRVDDRIVACSAICPHLEEDTAPLVCSSH